MSSHSGNASDLFGLEDDPDELLYLSCQCRAQLRELGQAAGYVIEAQSALDSASEHLDAAQQAGWDSRAVPFHLRSLRARLEALECAIGEDRSTLVPDEGAHEAGASE